MVLLLVSVLFMAITPPPADSLVRIESVKVAGNSYTDTGIIMNYLYLDEGDVMSMEELSKRVLHSERRLLDTRYFSKVRISTQSPDAFNARINVQVKEGFLWRFNGGLWFLGVGRDNLFGKGFDGSFYVSTRAQSLSLDNSYFKGTPFLLRLQMAHIIAEREVVFVEPQEDFEYRRTGATVSAGYNFNPDLSVSLIAGMNSFGIEEERFNGNTLVFLGENGVLGRTRDTELGFSAAFDGRDKRLTPSEGVLVQGAFLVRDGVGGVTLQVLDYLKTSPRTYFLTRFFMTSFGDGLPYHLWQGMGGINGLKFPGTGDRIGRTTLLVSLEPRLRFLEVPRYDAFLELRAFIDTGAAIMEVSDITLDGLVSGYGLGLRLWIGYPFFQNAVAYYGTRSGEGELFFRVGSSF
jgi:outer membrane protein assembly factor BamA